MVYGLPTAANSAFVEKGTFPPAYSGVTLPLFGAAAVEDSEAPIAVFAQVRGYPVLGWRPPCMPASLLHTHFRVLCCLRELWRAWTATAAQGGGGQVKRHLKSMFPNRLLPHAPIAAPRGRARYPHAQPSLRVEAVYWR
jgi:hypothetical protein